jgi:hypothetical protein
MLDSFLIPAKTIVTAKGDSEPLEVGSIGGPALLVTLSISSIVEQESIELSVFTSADGATWEAKPVASLAQKFYVGEYPLLVDLTQAASARFVRVHWEVNRWGRGPVMPHFEIGVRVREVPREMLEEARAEAQARR